MVRATTARELRRRSRPPELGLRQVWLRDPTTDLPAATGWAFAGHGLKVADLGARARRRLDRAVGGVFLGLAGLLATTKH